MENTDRNDARDGSRRDEGSLFTRMTSRREFLRMAGLGVAAIGLGSAGAGLLAACESEEATTTTAAAVPTTAGAATTVSVAPTTTAPAPTTTTAAPAAGPVRGGTITIGAFTSPADTLDPNTFYATNASLARVWALYDPLCNWERETTSVRMMVAEEITAESPTSWVIRVRNNAVWHNGKPVTADDVIYSFMRVLGLTPDTKGVRSLAADNLSALDPNNIKKLDDRTIRLTLKTPDVALDQGMPNVWMVPTDFDPTKPIGCGPFKLDSYTPQGESVMSRFEGYYQDGKPYVDKFIVQGFVDDAARINALLAGQIDLAMGIEFPNAAALKGNSAVTLNAYSTPSSYAFNMNLQQKPFTDVRARQAMRLLVDRQKLIDQALGGYATVANDLYCPQDPMFPTDIPQRETDVEQAMSLLKATGMDDVTIQLDTAPGAASIVDMAVAFGQQATKAGVKIQVNKLDVSTYFGEQYMNRVMSTSFWPGTPLESQVLISRLSTSPFNASHFEDAEFEKLFAQACAEMDVTKRKEIWREMMMIEYDRGTWLVPMYANQVDAIGKRVGNAPAEPIQVQPEPQEIWLKPEAV